MAGFLLLPAIGLVVYGAFLVVTTYATLRHPRRRTYAWAVSKRLPGDPGELSPALVFRRFEFESRGRRLKGWDIEGLDPAGPEIVLTHGWSDSRVGALARISALAPLASRVIAWDLPGHGESDGACDLGLRESEDLLKLLGTLGPVGKAGPGTPQSACRVLFGWSLGAGVSLGAAADACGVITEAPYRLARTPAMNVMRARRSPWRFNLPLALWLIGWRACGRPGAWTGFDRASLAGEVRCPVLVIRGSEDAVCPSGDAGAISAAARDATLVEIPGAGHNNVWTDPVAREHAARAVAEFLRRFRRSESDARPPDREGQ